MQRLKKFLVCLFLVTFQNTALADGRGNLTLDEMASRIQKQGEVQILSAEIQQGRQGQVYRFKVKKKGRVRVLLMYPDGTPVQRK